VLTVTAVRSNERGFIRFFVIENYARFALRLAADTRISASTSATLPAGEAALFRAACSLIILTGNQFRHLPVGLFASLLKNREAASVRLRTFIFL